MPWEYCLDKLVWVSSCVLTLGTYLMYNILRHVLLSTITPSSIGPEMLDSVKTESGPKMVRISVSPNSRNVIHSTKCCGRRSLNSVGAKMLHRITVPRVPRPLSLFSIRPRRRSVMLTSNNVSSLSSDVPQLWQSS